MLRCVSFLFHSALPAAAKAAATAVRERPGGQLSSSRAPASLGQSVGDRHPACAQSPRLPRPGPAAVASAWLENLGAPAARSPRASPRLAAAREEAGERASPRGGRGRWWRRKDGRQAEDPYGQREAQQEHHPARQRRQDLQKCPRREGVCRTLVIGSLHFCCLWLCNFPDYSKYQDGHVK